MQLVCLNKGDSMSITLNDFIEKMLFFFPSTKNDYMKCMEDVFEGVETIVIEDIFMPEIINLIKEEQEINLIWELFDYFEIISNHGDENLRNIFSITVLEILGNEKIILKKAQKYMGVTTHLLQREADKALGRQV